MGVIQSLGIVRFDDGAERPVEQRVESLKVSHALDLCMHRGADRLDIAVIPANPAFLIVEKVIWLHHCGAQIAPLFARPGAKQMNVAAFPGAGNRHLLRAPEFDCSSRLRVLRAVDFGMNHRVIRIRPEANLRLSAAGLERTIDQTQRLQKIVGGRCGVQVMRTRPTFSSRPLSPQESVREM